VRRTDLGPASAGAAPQNGWIDGDKAMMEALIAFKRAGADGVLISSER
jgi:delta-aminolevulinic acid dehydratase/porphobilinogen synthase